MPADGSPNAPGASAASAPDEPSADERDVQAGQAARPEQMEGLEDKSADSRLISLTPGGSLTFREDAEGDITLDISAAAPQAATRAAQLARLSRAEDGTYRLEQLDQARHVSVNGFAVSEAQLAPGAEIQLDHTSYVFTGAGIIQYDDLHTIQIDAVHLRQTVGRGAFGRRRKVVLDDLSLSIPPGSFVAIVGSSGAGKTTLLGALNGQRPAESGAVLYNGRSLYDDIGAFSQTQGYVPQDDIIHKYLSVERALWYAARLRLPQLSRRQIHARIAETLEDIDMTAQRHQLIARLSGGQRKRVSIGVELLAHPGVCFLDEPTSGLDPALDRHIMQLLRKLANRGETIVLTTHTMAHIDLCDYICFLAPGGRLAYYGAPAQMQRHFQMDDYADIFAALHNDPDHWVALFQQTPEYLRLVAGPRLQSENKSRPHPANATPSATGATALPKRHVNVPRQLLLLTMRYLEMFLHDRINLLILLAQAPIIALLVALLADANTVRHLTSIPNLMPPPDIYAQRTLFIMVCSAAWFGIINAIREIVKERPIYRRERAIYLGLFPYALSKALLLGGLGLVQSAILLAIVSAKAGLPTHGLLFAGTRGAGGEMLLTLWLVALAGVALGLMISALAPNADRAISLAPLLLVPQIIFANVIFTLSGVTNVLSWIVPSRWGVQALGSIARVRDHFAAQTQHAFYSSTASHVIGFWLALVGLIALYSALTLLALRRSDGPEAR